LIPYKAIIQNIIKNDSFRLDALRLDLIHPKISGNKWFKLRYNLERATREHHNQIVTFGGAHSNHIAATAAACELYGLKAIGIIRGEDAEKNNPTLKKAKQNGMMLHFVSREMYSLKNRVQLEQDLTKKFGRYYLVPEGGNNQEGIMGCTQIADPAWNYDYVLCASGTGTTYAGIAASLPGTIVIGINVLKGKNTLVGEVNESLNRYFYGKTKPVFGNEELNESVISKNLITDQYSFNGYAGYDRSLVEFKNRFESEYKIPLDYIYTNKLVYAAFDLVERKKFKSGSKILMIHSGGLQGNEAFEKRYQLIPTR
jgi:1-aminocyclopropane-1-carboxylate deaminase